MEIVSILVSVTIAVVSVIAAFRAKSEASQLSASNARMETELKQTKDQLESTQQEALEARELRIENARLSENLSSERELLNKASEEHRIKDKRVEDLTQQMQ